MFLLLPLDLTAAAARNCRWVLFGGRGECRDGTAGGGSCRGRGFGVGCFGGGCVRARKRRREGGFVFCFCFFYFFFDVTLKKKIMFVNII